MTADDFKSKNIEQFVDSALQTYARTGMYPTSRAMHECAHAYRRELLRIVAEWRERGGQHIDQPPAEKAEWVKHPA